MKSNKLRIEHLVGPNMYDHLPIHYVCKLTADNGYMLEFIIIKVIEYKLNMKLKSYFNYNLRYDFIKKFTKLFVELNQNLTNNEIIFKIEKTLEDFYKKTNAVNMLNHLDAFNLITQTWFFLQENLINKKSSKCGERPLGLAVKSNNINIVGILFKYGANFNLYSNGNNLPIHYVALNSMINTDMLNLMIQNNAISFKHNSNMENIFHLASLTNNYKFLIIIIEYFNQTNKLDILKRLIDSINSNQFTPLFVAIASSPTLSNSNDQTESLLDTSENEIKPDNSYLCAKLLIQNTNVNKFHLDSQANNIFHICALYNNYKVFNYLVYNNEELKELIYATNLQSDTILHLAALKNNFLIFKHIIQLIILKMIEPDYLFKKKNINGDTYFHVACKNGSIDIVKLICNTNFENYNPIKDIDNNSNTPLMNAILSNQFQIVNYLILNSQCTLADINAENNDKQIALHLSCKQGSVEISELLLRYGSVLNKNDNFDNNPLVYACLNGNSNLVEFLLIAENKNIHVSYYFFS